MLSPERDGVVSQSQWEYLSKGTKFVGLWVGVLRVDTTTNQSLHQYLGTKDQGLVSLIRVFGYRKKPLLQLHLHLSCSATLNKFGNMITQGPDLDMLPQKPRRLQG
jgi:hypothetical protein